ncbi:Serine--tRNA ligase [Candidatus Jidaibacter acanthamoeba]|uniref:Serine--tRNA ligase n=1 Tax=Candidatus Jidaibacter acanthamoebae TaxID=86105 RepID=A0A0C1MYR6_9RICK|nr:serine--tRNA ligase [Candidatus Jidaibacter acanthamoeba]KIE05076.1 Serine--tRNA ligase [Candidatus Jidaibacter acanthamoeba]
MHDIKFIRENPELFDKALLKRGISNISNDIITLDEKLRKEQTHLQEKQTKRNELAKEIGKGKAERGDVSCLLKQADELKVQVPQLEESIKELESKLEEMMINLPNTLLDDVPEGKDEDDNQEVRKWGEIKQFDFTPKHHYELGEGLNQMDFEAAAKMSGSRFVVLKKDLAQMERALANFMLDIHTSEFGYTEVSPPLLVKDEAMFGVGQLPKFDQDSFLTREGLRLIPTAEVSLTNLVREMILEEEELPLRYTAYTPSFRSEAGSAGKDTRGMIRVHQFSKVELVSIVRPRDSKAEHERMTTCAEEILKRLELPYRIMLLCGGDTGFSSQKTYDFEVWLPGQNKYREISSCSTCGDFQARRMKARYKELDSRKNYFVHTLNGSGLAVGRTIVAILENYQNSDGSINIPHALQKYMNGTKIIGR